MEFATRFRISAGAGLWGSGKPWLLGYLPRLRPRVFTLRVGLGR